jgi:hypothetical protein
VTYTLYESSMSLLIGNYLELNCAGDSIKAPTDILRSGFPFDWRFRERTVRQEPELQCGGLDGLGNSGVLFRTPTGRGP